MSGPVIGIFTPPCYRPRPLEPAALAARFGRELHYAAFGRVALYHILRALQVRGTILLPAYLCATVLEPVARCGLTPVFYDLDPRDLNADLSSIEYLAAKYNCSTLLVASMYGNPADLGAIEAYCRKKGILLIDDAAQSFGAHLHGRLVGSFGNAGFFSFSPGKPTAGHMGAFFWTERENYEIKRSRHYLYHYVTWLDFFYNRMHRYTYHKFKLFKLLSALRAILYKFIDITNDDLCAFELDILGGILAAQNCGDFDFRKRWVDAFIQVFNDTGMGVAVSSLRGESSPHKMVGVFRDTDIAHLFRNFMANKRIYTSDGYRPLTRDLSDFPGVQQIDGRVVELPVEKDEKKMSYLLECIREFRCHAGR